MGLSPGTKIGHYDVTGLLGEGGMGQVWQATDTQLNRQVALKILPDAFADDPDRLARFTREAQILASLNHPNIAAIYGIEEAEGTRALVLELVDGPTLADRISKGPIPLDEALPIAKQIAEALEAAHEAGVIHRDLKPANIKVREDGTVKVLDFGLAKAFRPDASDQNMSMSPTISLTAAATQMGMVIGTAAYMAPEQAKGQPVDKRADVWAFGAVLFEMLTGAKPFVGDDVSETMARVIDREPEWDTLPDRVPPGLSNFLRHCLLKNPKKRVRDIGDVRLAMEGAFETTDRAMSEPAGGAPLRVWQRPVVAGLGTVAVAVLVTGLAVWNLTRPDPPPADPVVRFSIPLGPDEIFTRRGRHAVAFSPDGSQLVYLVDNQLLRRRLDQSQVTAIPVGRGNPASPFFSPGGEWVGFHAEGQLRKVALSGGVPVILGEAEIPWGASWGADDTILFGQGPEGIWRIPGGGGKREVVISIEDGEEAHGPQMLPGDEWVLYTLLPSGVRSWDEAQIVAESIVTRERVVVFEGGRDAQYVETGHLVYASEGVLFAVAFDVDLHTVVGEPVQLVESVLNLNSTGAVQYALADDGSLAYISGDTGTQGLVWLDPERGEEALAVPERQYRNLHLSPSGTHAAVTISDDSGNLDVWVSELGRGRALVPLTRDEANIMLTKAGAKLLDFGLAKLRDPKAAVISPFERETRRASLTGEGAILGTLQYMAPEQLEGKDADARTDIFAFGHGADAFRGLAVRHKTPTTKRPRRRVPFRSRMPGNRKLAWMD